MCGDLFVVLKLEDRWFLGWNCMLNMVFVFDEFVVSKLLLYCRLLRMLFFEDNKMNYDG